jgi:phospholipid/cholesterol/gamma-HCH transport system substrate-binding protein
VLSLAGKRMLGIGVILFAVALVVLGATRPTPFKESRTIVAEFDHVQGLGRIDRNVRIGGANAGEIGDVTRVDETVLVELEIEPDIPIRTDARANLRPHTLFEGSAFVDLHPGSPSAPELGDGETIPSEQTDTYVSLDEATRVLNEENRKTLKALVGSSAKLLSADAVRGLRRTLENAPELLESTGPTARALQGPGTGELSGAISGLADTVDAVASREADLVPLAQHTNRTIRALRVDAGRPLDTALAHLPGALEQLDAASEPVTALLERVARLGDELQPAARELAPLLRDSRPLLERITPTIEETTPLIAGLRTVLRRATDAAPELRRAIDALAPGSEILVDSLLPAMNAKSYFGLPVYAQLAQAFTAAGSAARTFQTPEQNASAGHIIRVGAYIDPEGTVGGVVPPSCNTIALINEELAGRLENLGLCTT